ncbi:uncharacterized protein LOC131880152 [Tigriopus californicus]|uniref:uncharacterized protein LOC131880152 n=1 Tax=Tigriopus californicus TaxID=6832 RepID=UPI0027D9E2A4|nr:uncharacterized protein LOC131880152 [Tigriopus californicus]
MKLTMQYFGIKTIIASISFLGAMYFLCFVAWDTQKPFWTSVNCNISETLVGLHQTDPKLIQCLRTLIIDPPKPSPYCLAENFRSLYEQDKIIVEKMANLSPGNFIEIGSGSRTSNTFLLERTNNWTGLLVEPDERSFATYLSCHRNVSLLNSCISRDQYVERTNFILHKGGGSRATYSLPKRYLPGFKHVAETCFPLYSIMLAINRTNIGVLSLKSGYEEDAILASLPWDKVNISLVAVPVTHFVDRGAAVRKTLTRNNYEVVALAMGKFDIIAVKKPERKP